MQLIRIKCKTRQEFLVFLFITIVCTNWHCQCKMPVKLSPVFGNVKHDCQKITQEHLSSIFNGKVKQNFVMCGCKWKVSDELQIANDSSNNKNLFSKSGQTSLQNHS